jgi:mercuric ion transport protein
MSASRIGFATAAWLFLGGVVLQVFLAGLGAFKVTDWTAHAGFGWLLASWPLFVIFPFAFVATRASRTRWLTVALVFSAALQPELAAARHESQVMAALHPVNAMLVFWFAWQVARASLRDERRPAQQAETPSGPSPADIATLPAPPVDTPA